MFKILFSILLLSLTTTAFAQLLNPSFEQTDSTGALSDWKVTQGNFTKLSAVTFGAIPFTAFEGNYFTLLESDTLNTPIKAGTLEQSFVYADTPKNISINNLFIPENTAQHARIKLLFTKWNGTSRDTVLYLNDTLPIIAEGTSIPIRWNTYTQTLTTFYRNQQLPDSAIISITNDDSQTGKSIRLYLDNIRFGKWPVGMTELQPFTFQLFPNPAQDRLTIQASKITDPLTIRIISLSGQTLETLKMEEPSDRYEVNTSGFASGLYVLQILSQVAVSQQLITIQH
ncbi:MAG: T9SS type A sorting domain-containing protein [Bacteroidota bacterium]